jgi:hypothetical protein
MSEEVIENTTKTKKKRQKAEDLIGSTFNNGKLKVIGIEGKTKSFNKIFKVTCTECSKDPELFPLGYFKTTKRKLELGIIPCGCSKAHRWEPFQYLTLARRAGEGRFTVHSFTEKFKGVHTKVNLECIKDGYKWSAEVASVIHTGAGCPNCSRNARPSEQEALDKCTAICKEMNYEVIGFVGNYKNNKTYFEYKCPKHGIQKVSYNGFINWGSRCQECSREIDGWNGYYPSRKDEKDFLYVLNFDDKFIKVGRSFDVDGRIPKLRFLSKIQEIIKLRIFTATHKEIYDLEQELLDELRERNFQHYVEWSKECFGSDSFYVLTYLLDYCGFEEISC